MAEHAAANHPRLLLRNFLSLDQCKELEFIHKSSSSVGYRPNVFSTTLSHLIATNCSHFIMPLVPIREMLKEKVEEFFGCEYELCIEFTGLISWSKGASIGWHSDDNRPYLKQRDFSVYVDEKAVCYLNSAGKNFEGGLFHFQDGEPATVVPSAGDLLIYTADNRNVHSVDEITNGERVTLTLWFSRNSTHDEDKKLIPRLSQMQNPTCGIPSPASSNMYLYSPDQAPPPKDGSTTATVIDISCARIYILGFGIYSSASDLSDPFDLLSKPLQLVRGDELFDHKFGNILHALQVVQYYYTWTWTELMVPTINRNEAAVKVIQLSDAQKEIVNDLKSKFVRDDQLPHEIFSYVSRCDEIESVAGQVFSWSSFSRAVSACESYNLRLHEEMQLSLPYWKTHESIFSVSFGE